MFHNKIQLKNQKKRRGRPRKQTNTINIDA